MFQNLTVFVSILKTVPAISRGGFYFLHQFIAFIDMKIVYKRNLKKFGTIDAYNENTVLKEAAERFRERTGHYSERILADQIYRTRENRKYCKMHGIRYPVQSLGDQVLKNSQ